MTQPLFCFAASHNFWLGIGTIHCAMLVHLYYYFREWEIARSSLFFFFSHGNTFKRYPGTPKKKKRYQHYGLLACFLFFSLSQKKKTPSRNKLYTCTFTFLKRETYHMSFAFLWAPPIIIFQTLIFDQLSKLPVPPLFCWTLFYYPDSEAVVVLPCHRGKEYHSFSFFILPEQKLVV